LTRCRRDAASPGVHRCLLGLIAAALALVPAVVPAASSASSSVPRQKLEAERLHVSRAAGRVVRDASASGRRALVLTGRGTARIRVSVTRESRLDVVARAARCSGGPRLVVAIDGARVISGAVKGRRWSTAKAGATIAAGAHRVTLRLANPHRSSHCRRNVRIDRLDFVGAATAPAAPGAPAPPAVKAPPATAAPVATGTPAAPGTRWIPALGITWQWQLSGTVDQSVDAQMYDIDLFDTAASLVASLHASGRHVVCYVDAGTYEPGRPDAGSFPAAVIGSDVAGWPGEKWLDVRRLDALGPIIERRLDLCRQKGFDGVEPDNVDGYANASGFPLSAADQLRYNRFVAAAAHARGLSVGLKNDLEQAPALQPDFDWALNEQCYQYGECGLLQPFAQAGKAVFIAEYDLDPSAFCAQAKAAGYTAMRKTLALDAWRQSC
jgi:hypothetical protein